MHCFNFHGIRHLSLCTSWGTSLNHSSKEMYKFPQKSQKPNIYGFKKTSCSSPTRLGRNQVKLSEKKNKIDFPTSICHIQSRQPAKSSFYLWSYAYMFAAIICSLTASSKVGMNCRTPLEVTMGYTPDI